jgi:hypothetical protein
MKKMKKLRKRLVKALRKVDRILEEFDDTIIREDCLESSYEIKGKKRKKKK